MYRLVALSACLVLAACADSEPPDQTPADDDGAYNMIDPVRAGVTEEAVPAIGEWSRTMQDERPALTFGPAGAEPLFSIRCDQDGMVFNRHGLVEAGDAGTMTLRLEESPHRLAVSSAKGPLPKLSATVPSNDPLLARLRAHESSLEVVVGDGPPLLLPASPMIGTFIEDCASGEVSPIAAGDNETANAAAPADAAD